MLVVTSNSDDWDGDNNTGDGGDSNDCGDGSDNSDVDVDKQWWWS